ncbi:MAG: hypothetical protein LWW85_08645, partial [Marinilabiliales bacterium]|nr:hypothetical protein [Marinilabiliales bacterium]
FKSVIFVLIPVYLFSGDSFHLIFAVAYIFVLLLITAAYYLFSKRAWWDLLSGTKLIQFRTTNQSIRSVSMTSLTIVLILTISIGVYPLTNFQQFRTSFLPKYPVNSETKRFADFIDTHAQDPVDYIFNLFEKYDLVVLSERLHPEYTQYEFISSIIRDKRFVDKIGNVYTECGSISSQGTLDTYLKTVFLNEDSLNKATAFLQRNSNSIWPLWINKNLFDLLKLANQLNINLVDSLKINWYFTDIPVKWEIMTSTSYNRQEQGSLRDKVMATHVIDTYRSKILRNERRTKGLVIMNFRHGYGLIKDRNGKKANHFFNQSNTTAFLMDSLPDKVCNVMLNTVSLRYGFILTPIQSGKWDMAFSLCGNPNVGFNFANSPFGADQFDGFVGNSSDKLRYEDVFTGFVFYKPLEQHLKKEGFPYMLYNFEDSLMRRANCVSPSYAASWKNMIAYYKQNETHSEAFSYAVIYNLLVNIGFSLLVLLVLAIGLIFYWTDFKK